MDNLNRVQNIFISDGTALPANNAATTTMTVGDIGVFGTNWLALNPAGGDTITTEPSIFITERKVDSAGVEYLKKSSRISGLNVISYNAESYKPSQRQVECIGYNRSTATGTIEVNASTNYNFTIRFKNDKFNYSQRPEMLNVNFTSSASATQSLIADQIVSAINNSSFADVVVALKVGDGTGAYGLTAATNFGIEVTGIDIEQFYITSYQPNIVYFTVSVNDDSGFGTTTTKTTIQNFTYGIGTYSQVYMLENKLMANEGIMNRRQWPIPVLDYSSTSTLVLSAAIGVATTGTSGTDQVTYATTIAAILRPGEKVEIDAVNYEIKYIKGDGTGVGAANAVVLTSALTTSPAGTDVTKVRLKYDLVNIEFNDSINTPIGVVAVANKSVIIAVPAIITGGAYSSLSTAGTNLKALLDGWMTTTPLAPATITI